MSKTLEKIAARLFGAQESQSVTVGGDNKPTIIAERGGRPWSAPTTTEKKPMSKKAPSRIYEVGIDGSTTRRLVRAQNRSQAIAHVVQDSYVAEVPTQDRLVFLAGAGVKIEESDSEPL
jgi:hypothetical protein